MAEYQPNVSVCFSTVLGICKKIKTMQLCMQLGLYPKPLNIREHRMDILGSRSV